MTVPIREALRFWCKLGFISFGGPAGQIAIMHQELVEKKRWISEQRFLHALNYCMVLPGPEAQQLATYLGWLMHRTWGGIAAGLLFILPSLIIMIGLSWLYLVYGNLPAVSGVLYGIKPAVVAIILFAAWRIASRTLKHFSLWLIAIGAFLAIWLANLAFPAIIAVAALLGWLISRYRPHWFAAQSAHGVAVNSATIIDDVEPSAHPRFSWTRLLAVVAIFVGLWAIVIGGLTLFFGWHHPLTQMAWFFTKAALLTFGGAYAVLPYVFQAAVEHYQWITPAQMIDGLALGETTPGPLIMIVAYIGFIGGWSKALFGIEQLFWSGAIAACVATLFTFLPSFLFILAGGPFVESTQGDLKFTAPLNAITAAVVGVIVDLALFFAQHVFLPRGLNEPIQWPAVLIACLAGVALFRYKLNIILVIIGAAVLGVWITGLM